MPRKKKPTTSRNMFTIVENILAERGVIFAKTTAAPVTPVSYTHLDVYKRQEYNRGRIGCCLLW